ncbi:hypothetical protein [Oceanobacillus luteolus]
MSELFQRNSEIADEQGLDARSQPHVVFEIAKRRILQSILKYSFS